MNTRKIEIDGSKGEGGGQVLRTSLTVAMLYGLKLSIRNIRGKRPKAGLMRQHLTCVHAAQAICNAKVSGAHLGSGTLTFEPGDIIPGDYHFDVGSAGSTTLVFQTILLPLLKAPGSSTVSFVGGTHNPLAPPLTFLEYAFLPLIRAMGAKVDIDIERWGYMPAGGGQWSARIAPSQLAPIEITERGMLTGSEVTAYLSNIRREVGEREIHTYKQQCQIPETVYDIEFPESVCPGNLLSHAMGFGDLRVCFTELGRQRLRAEQVAATLAEKVRRYLNQDVVLCEHLADQIMLPMLAAGGGRFSCSPPSLHARTNSELIEALTGYRISTIERNGAPVLTLG